jgi:hypothetical protein
MGNQEILQGRTPSPIADMTGILETIVREKEKSA